MSWLGKWVRGAGKRSGGARGCLRSRLEEWRFLAGLEQGGFRVGARIVPTRGRGGVGLVIKDVLDGQIPLPAVHPVADGGGRDAVGFPAHLREPAGPVAEGGLGEVLVLEQDADLLPPLGLGLAQLD